MSKLSLAKNPEAVKIIQECAKGSLTDKQIQQKLLEKFNYEWSIISIRRVRRNIGFNKKNTENQIKQEEVAPLSATPPPGLSPDEKAQWFRNDFEKSHLYQMLKNQFDSDEVSAYLEEYGRICCQFEDIVASEFFQIDDFLKHRILINRQLLLMKSIQKDIISVSGWITNHPVKEGETPEQKQERTTNIVLLGQKNDALKNANDRYDKLVGERDKISKNLAATRRDRLDQLAGGKEDFLHLVSLLQYSEAERERHGKFAELTKLASKDILDNLSKPVEFPDGSKDYVFMDGENYAPEDEE